jgi:hypothetical protein
VRRALALLILALSPVPAAQAGYRPGEPGPEACRSAAFTDSVGTPGPDEMIGGRTPQRLYGLTGDDILRSSPTRATCMFAGQGDDILDLHPAGGVALGEDGSDVLLGSPKDDALSGGAGPDTIAGGGGADQVHGGAAVDAIDGGDGDDMIDSTDGRPELVVCGPGTDTAVADRSDVLVGCERVQVTGRALRRKRLQRHSGGRRSSFRMRFVAPQPAAAGEYRVLVSAPCGPASPPVREVARTRAHVFAGDATHFAIRPPAVGWCPGTYTGALVRERPCPPGRDCAVARPAEPLAWLRFTVG